MEVNHLYFLHFLDENFSKEKCLSLDFGCGNGDFISYANNDGYRFCGVDNYYDATNLMILQNSLAKEHIDIIDNTNVLPFKDKTFDFITSICVFEHVENLETALNEMKRVLKDDGKILCSFPFKFSYQEGHYGIPFSHWFKPSSRIRKLWVMIFYKFGFGVDRDGNLSFDEWYKIAFGFIDYFCHYRTRSEFFVYCNKADFTVHSRDKERLLFRLKNSKGLILKMMRVIINIIPNWIILFLLQRRGSTCLELIKTKPKKE